MRTKKRGVIMTFWYITQYEVIVNLDDIEKIDGELYVIPQPMPIGQI